MVSMGEGRCLLNFCRPRISRPFYTLLPCSPGLTGKKNDDSPLYQEFRTAHREATLAPSAIYRHSGSRKRKATLPNWQTTFVGTCRNSETTYFLPKGAFVATFVPACERGIRLGGKRPIFAGTLRYFGLAKISDCVSPWISTPVLLGFINLRWMRRAFDSRYHIMSGFVLVRSTKMREGLLRRSESDESFGRRWRRGTENRFKFQNLCIFAGGTFNHMDSLISR